MDALTQTIIDNHRMLDIIRLRNGKSCTVETLKDDLDISRASADKMFNELQDKIINKVGKDVAINPQIGYFIGISIGSTHLRLSLLGLDLKPIPRIILENHPHFKKLLEVAEINCTSISENCFTYNTPECNKVNESNSLDNLRYIIQKIIYLFLNQNKDNGIYFPIFGIGFGVSGPVDYNEKIWNSAPRITDVKNITISDLVGFEIANLLKEKQIFVSIDNNAKSAIISEYQFLLEKNNGKFTDDIALIYYGTGLGFSTIIGKKLIRGSHNMCGEIGHIPLLFNDNKKNKIEACTIEEEFHKDINKSIRKENFIKYLPYVLQTVNCLFGLDSFIIVGHNAEEEENIVPAIMDQRAIFTIKSTQRYCKAEFGRRDLATAAIGAAIESYFTMCNYTGGDDYINLAKDVEWIKFQ